MKVVDSSKFEQSKTLCLTSDDSKVPLQRLKLQEAPETVPTKEMP